MCILKSSLFFWPCSKWNKIGYENVAIRSSIRVVFLSCTGKGSQKEQVQTRLWCSDPCHAHCSCCDYQHLHIAYSCFIRSWLKSLCSRQLLSRWQKMNEGWCDGEAAGARWNWWLLNQQTRQTLNELVKQSSCLLTLILSSDHFNLF